ncbi:MAG: oligosaccharide flippase family protein [Acidobacteria bacterium]|nr:oligosaccharide flippase family protein [Acidobacteriota bacterium]
MSKPAASSIAIRTGWRGTVDTLRLERSHSRLLSGSLIMLLASTAVSGVNFAYNVVIARLLGPAAFGHTSAAVTLLMLASALTLSFQLVCAKFVARNQTAGGKAAVYHYLRRRSWLVGALLGAGFIVLSAPVSWYLRLPSPWIVILLAFGLMMYVPLGVKRGAFQGTCSFGLLSANFLLEVAVKFVGAVILVELGFGVLGAVGAITASLVLAYFLPLTPKELEMPQGSGIPASFGEGMQAIVFFVGQVVINNIDILLVKHFFRPEDAGLYAAVALVGRVLYFAAWSVVSVMFPISAGAKARDTGYWSLVIPLALVSLIAVGFILVSNYLPGLVIQTVFGTGFTQIAPLLSLYAATTGAYALAVVLMAYEMSRRIANTGWLQLAFSGAVIIGIYAFHSTLREVIIVQLILMVFLLIAVSMPFFRRLKVATAAQEAA